MLARTALVPVIAVLAAGSFAGAAPSAARGSSPPSRFLQVGGRRVEYFVVPATTGESPHPGVLFVHGHGSDARRMLPIGTLLASRGFTALLVSMPGYGRSDGPADFMGPATRRALAAALRRLVQTGGVDPERLGAWGMSRGAGPVALLAQDSPELDAVVLQAGIYDLWAVYRGTPLPGLPEAIVAEAGTDSAAWRERSAVARPSGIRAATLILHGERDERVPVSQARRFHQILKQGGGDAEAHFFAGAGHTLPRARACGEALAFLTRHLAR